MKKFFIAYSLLSLAVIAVKLPGLNQLETWLKPLLMPSLMLFYFLYKKPFLSFDYKILLALLFSTLGDILLMPSVNLFIGGILSFLMAHVFYISAFLSEDLIKLGEIQSWKKMIFGLGILVYASLLILLLPQLETIILKTAIIIYGSMLLALLFSSIIRKPNHSKSSDLIAIGAFLFMLSDSMIAINKFLIELPVSSLLIMGTYTIAQAFLVYGSLIRNK